MKNGFYGLKGQWTDFFLNPISLNPHCHKGEENNDLQLLR